MGRQGVYVLEVVFFVLFCFVWEIVGNTYLWFAHL